MILWEHTPGAEELKEAEKKIQTPDRLVCTPQYYGEAKAFGLWEAADKKNPLDAWILKKEEQVLSVFSEQVEEHQWYGFWNYGDIMRMYDSVRHCWKEKPIGFMDFRERRAGSFCVFRTGGRASVVRILELR